MAAPAPTSPSPRRRNGAGVVFLICGMAFLGVGIGTRQAALLTMGPTFLVLGIALMARSRNTSR